MQKTEARNQATTHIDRMTTAEMLACIQRENLNAAKAVGEALPSIEKACDSIAEGLSLGGRLIYIGAGSSGRLGVLDATECPPTYGVSPELVSGIIAGGDGAMFHAVEGAEDDPELGARDLMAKNPTRNDRIVGISASGNAAYVAGAVARAKSIGCVTIGVTSNFGSRLALETDIPIVTDTGAEVIAGSTRMKAGSAQKMVLNMLSTCAMIKTGHVCENLMINLRPTNKKLADRMAGIVSELCGTELQESRRLLEENGFSIREVVGLFDKNEQK